MTTDVKNSIVMIQNKDRNQVNSFVPFRIIEIEIGQPLPPTITDVDDRTGQKYRRALCLVRLHTQPLGVVELPLSEKGIGARDYAEQIWNALQEQINAHLQHDGLPPVTGLDEVGLVSSVTPLCLEKRNQFLAHAPFVSVIVPTHDRPDRLQLCLRSLLHLHYPYYEIIIVDNAPSTDATMNIVQEAQQAAENRPMLSVRYLRENRPGPSSARNCGIREARGEVLAFVDDDAVVDHYWLAELVRGFSVIDDVVCVTGLVLPLELETPAQFWFEEYGGFNKGFTQRIFDMKEHRPRTPLYPYAAGKFGTGASMAFTAAFLLRVNGFDMTLAGNSQAPGSEDVDLFFQAVMQGHKLVYRPTSIVFHLHRRDYTALCKQICHYGVGLTSHPLRIIHRDPRLLFNLLARVPYGIYFALSSQSSKNSKKSKTYPKELTMMELKGMLRGPFFYIRSWWIMRNVPKTLAPIGVPVPLSGDRENRERE